MSHDYVFPYRSESERVLRHAVEADPSGALGHYLLGNLQYDKRPDEAMAAWEAAAAIDPELTMVRRNLAFGTFHHRDQVNNAIDLLTGAIQKTPDHPLWYAELVSYYEASDRDPKECLGLLEANRETVLKNVSAPQGLVKLYNLTGAYENAIQLLGSHHFRTWEGGRSIYWHYVDAHVLRALDLMGLARYEEAIDHLVKAMEYPENLEVGKPLNDERNALMYYLMGKAYSEMGQENDAREAFLKSVECENSWSWPDLNFYQGLSYRELGETDRAKEKFDLLEGRGSNMLEQHLSAQGIGVEDGGSMTGKKSASEGYYLLGLASLGLEDHQKAIELFQKAAAFNPYHLWAKYYLEK
jgi:tetratricopeptide (TPR) repeat protein